MRAYPVPAAFIFIAGSAEEFAELRRRRPELIALTDRIGYLVSGGGRLAIYAKSLDGGGYIVVHEGTDVPVVLTAGVEAPQDAVLSLAEVQKLGIDVAF